MNDAIELSFYGALKTPYMVRLQEMSIIKVKNGESFNSQTKKTEATYTSMIGDAVMNIVSNPEKPIEVGNIVQAITGKYEILEIIEQREARGNYSMFDFKPIMQSCKVKFHSLIKPFTPKS